MLCKALIAKGCNCVEAADGFVAIQKVKEKMLNKEKGYFDVILMDFVMPLCDGPTGKFMYFYKAFEIIPALYYYQYYFPLFLY